MKVTMKTNYSKTETVEVLTHEEQEKFILMSSIHQYGILFRLPLLTGLSMHELLGLQWSDIDPENKQIHIRYESCDDGPAYNLYPASTPRSISLPSYLFGELADLYEAQRDTMAKYQLEAQTNAVASTVKGFHIPPWLLEFFFTQLLAVCKLPKYSFSILCDTWDYQCQCGIDNPAPYADGSRERQLFTYVYSKMKEVWH